MGKKLRKGEGVEIGDWNGEKRETRKGEISKEEEKRGEVSWRKKMGRVHVVISGEGFTSCTVREKRRFW